MSARGDGTDLSAERLDVPERLIVAPARGVFEPLRDPGPTDGADAGGVVSRGDVVGRIVRTTGVVDVVSVHAGVLLGLLRLPGERVREGEPLAWLREQGTY